MIALRQTVLSHFTEKVSQVPSTEHHEMIQALAPDSSHESGKFARHSLRSEDTCEARVRLVGWCAVAPAKSGSLSNAHGSQHAVDPIDDEPLGM